MVDCIIFISFLFLTGLGFVVSHLIPLGGITFLCFMYYIYFIFIRQASLSDKDLEE